VLHFRKQLTTVIISGINGYFTVRVIAVPNVSTENKKTLNRSTSFSTKRNKNLSTVKMLKMSLSE